MDDEELDREIRGAEETLVLAVREATAAEARHDNTRYIAAMELAGHTASILTALKGIRDERRDR